MIYDMHAHIAGMEWKRNGNYLSKKILRSIPFRYFAFASGIKRREVGEPAIDERFANVIIGWIETSVVDRVVLLAYDAVHDETGEINWDETHMVTGNDYVAALAEKHEKILFGASVHPYRGDAIDELERVAAMGARLVKWLPTGQNIDLSDPRCQTFYQALARLKLPLLCHTGMERAVINLNPAMNDPEQLLPALDAGVTVIAAHCGSRSMPFERCYYRRWRELAIKHGNLYGDVSSFGLPGRSRVMRQILTDRDIHHKLLYGSDLPVGSFPMSYAPELGLSRALRLQLNANPFDKAYLTIKELGIDAEVFRRLERLPTPEQSQN